MGKSGTPLRAERAFTIVEVAIAATVLLVAFTGVISAITAGSEMQATARRQALAEEILQHKFEEMRTINWTTLTNTAIYPLGTASVDIPNSFDTAIAAAGLTKGTTLSSTVTLVLERTISAPATDLRQITFTVKWRARPAGVTQRDYSRAQTSYFSRYGLRLSYLRT